MVPWKPKNVLSRTASWLLPPLVLLLVAACSDSGLTNGSGGVLVGTWGSSDATLSADHSGVALAIPCIRAQFPAIKLDDTLGFRTTGVITEGGGWTLHPGDPYTVTGRLVGNRAVTPIPWLNVVPIPWLILDPGADTLRPGVNSSHACNQ
jgi:hypothetical protein